MTVRVKYPSLMKLGTTYTSRIAAIEKQRPIAQARLLFPERAGDFREQAAPTDGGGVREAGRAGIGVDGRAVPDDEQSGGGMGGHRGR